MASSHASTSININKRQSTNTAYRTPQALGQAKVGHSGKFVRLKLTKSNVSGANFYISG